MNKLSPKDIVFDEGSLLRYDLGVPKSLDSEESVTRWFTENRQDLFDKVLDIVRNDSDAALELLSFNKAGRVPYVVSGSRSPLFCRYADRNHTGVEGANLLGHLFYDVSRVYHDELLASDVEEAPVRPDQIIVDYQPKDEYMSYVESLEQDRQVEDTYDEYALGSGQDVLKVRQFIERRGLEDSVSVADSGDGRSVIDFGDMESSDVEEFIDGLRKEVKVKHRVLHDGMVNVMGRRFIHVDDYKPARYQRNTSLNGSTGHALRKVDDGVTFHSYVNPFGTAKKSLIKVRNEAEASFLYEKGLRGELDYDLLFSDLVKGGLNFGGYNESEIDSVKRDVRARFEWIREQILTDRSLRDMQIVAPSLLVSDTSFGRSIHNAENAPSAAHILARYINNPVLLYKENSVNGVLSALETEDKSEAFRFSSVSGNGTLTILVDGSDTIGGREPGMRSVRKQRDVYKRDDKGFIMKDRWGKPIVESKETVNEMPLKSADEIQADYDMFRARMDAILTNVNESVKIRFVTGKSVGISQMVMRYVRENGGRTYDWYYDGGRPVEINPESAVDGSRFSVVRMGFFNDVFPVLVGCQDEVTVVTEENVEGVPFTKASARGKNSPLNIQCYIEYSVSGDTKNEAILRRGSLVAQDSSLPLIHVIENYSEEEQKTILLSDSSTVRSELFGEGSFSESILTGVKDVWDMDAVQDLSYRFTLLDQEVSSPLVLKRYSSSVFVNGVPFLSVYGAYNALLLKSVSVVPVDVLKELSRLEDSVDSLQKFTAARVAGLDVSPAVKEQCLRNAVHMMAFNCPEFAEQLMDTGEAELVMSSTLLPDRDLFVDLDGHGRNFFGIVCAHERDGLLHNMELQKQKMEDEQKRAAEEMMRYQRRLNVRKAQGEKVKNGFPVGVEESQDAVWFLGTALPSQLILPEGETSFDRWNQGYNGEDILNREKATRQVLPLDGTSGETVENRYVFLYPTNQMVVLGRAFVKNFPDARDLAGLRRVNPATGKEFTCAFGIPVKRDAQMHELNDKFGFPCSYRLDGDNAALAASIVRADSLARSTALREGMKLCYASYIGRDGVEYDDLSRVFSDKVYDYPRAVERLEYVIQKNPRTGEKEKVCTGKVIYVDPATGKKIEGATASTVLPVEVTKKVWNKEKHRQETVVSYVPKKQWIPNPHGSKLNAELCRRYEGMLNNGNNMPLNCIAMPRDFYEDVDEAKFVADLSFALKVANATAVELDKPLRFALDNEGRIELGSGVPEKFRPLAESIINSFIGVVREEDLINGSLPELERVSIYKSVSGSTQLSRSGCDITLRPNALASAFGRFDFKEVAAFGNVPVHEMAFRDADGDFFRLTESRLASKFSKSDIDKYVHYEKNDPVRFVIHSTNEEKVPQFINIVKSYVERAQKIKVETRLVSVSDISELKKNLDAEKDIVVDEENDIIIDIKDNIVFDESFGESLDGYIKILSSNSDEMPQDDHTFSARDIDAVLLPNRFDGTDNDSVYYGKEDAKDAFDGYVQFRYTLPDGTVSDWVTVDDRLFARDIVFSKIFRSYRSDTVRFLSESAINTLVKADAVRHAGAQFLDMKFDSSIVPDDKVVEVTAAESKQVQKEEKPVVKQQTPRMMAKAKEKSLNIYFSAGENAELSNFAKRPFKYDIKKFQIKR